MSREFAELPTVPESLNYEQGEKERLMLLENAVQYFIAKTETKNESEISTFLKTHSAELRQFLQDDEVQVALREYLAAYPSNAAIEKLHHMEPFLQLHRDYLRSTIQ